MSNKSTPPLNWVFLVETNHRKKSTVTIRNNLLEQLLVSYGGTHGENWSRNSLLAGILIQLGGTPPIYASRNELLSLILSALGGTPHTGQARNSLLYEIVLSSGGEAVLPATRNELLSLWLGSASQCNIYYFKPADADRLDFASAFTGNFKANIATFNGVAGLDSNLSGLTLINSPEAARADASLIVWNKVDTAVTAMAGICDNTFDGVIANYAKDDVWFDVGMGVPAPQGIWSAQAVWS